MTIDVVRVLWLRQLKRYGRSRARIVGSLGQPLLFLIALGFGFGPVFQRAGQGSYIQFLAPGVICMTILLTAIFNGIELIWDRQFGFLKETLVAPVSRLTIMTGRTLGGATVDSTSCSPTSSVLGGATGSPITTMRPSMSVTSRFEPNISTLNAVPIARTLCRPAFTENGRVTSCATSNRA